MKRLFSFVMFLSIIILPMLGSAETFYVRPSGGNYGLEDGSSYANGWDGFSDIQWGSGSQARKVDAGDTLYVCGTHRDTLTVLASGLHGYPIVIRGDCPSEAGSISGAEEITFWAGPDDNGQYYITGLATFIPRWLICDKQIVHKKEPDALTENTWGFNSVTDMLYYKPPAGYTPYDFTIEYSRRAKALSIDSKNHIYLTNITFEMANGTNLLRDGALVDIRNSDYITFQNCKKRFGWLSALFIGGISSSCDNITVASCDISWSGNGITTGGSKSLSRLTIKDTAISYIGTLSWDTRAGIDREGIGLNGHGKADQNILIEDVVVHDVGNDTDTNGTGIFLYQCNVATVRRFEIYNCSRLGLRLTDGAYSANRNVSVYHGLIFNCGTSTNAVDNFAGGLALASHNSGGFDNTLVSNLTIVRNYGTASSNINKKGGLIIYKNYDAANDAPITVRNVISGENITYDLSYKGGTKGFTALDLDYNCYCRSSGSMIKYGTDTYSKAQFTTYKRNTSHDANSICQDPRFKDLSKNNYGLQSNSPCWDAGTNIIDVQPTAKTQGGLPPCEDEGACPNAPLPPKRITMSPCL